MTAQTKASNVNPVAGSGMDHSSTGDSIPAFTPANPALQPAMETTEQTAYGSAYARYFPTHHATWLAYVRFRLESKSVDIVRSSEVLPTESDAVAWCEAAMNEGPTFLTAYLEANHE
jgi:hypothetical protein